MANPRTDFFDVKIIIPANSESGFYYSEAEISPNKNSVELLFGKELGDSKVVLKPTEGADGKVHGPTYITHGRFAGMSAA